MTAAISDFLANFQGGGYRPNRFNVILTFPGAVPNALGAATKFGFTCRSASIPQLTLGVAEVPYMGRMAKIPGDKVWDDWNVTVMVDMDFVVRDVFESWQDMILGFDSNVATNGMQNPTNCFATATVQALDRYDNVIKNYTASGIWPSSVGEMQLAYDDNNTVSSFDVTFSVNNWSTEATKY